jgi:hypothetical protein
MTDQTQPTASAPATFGDTIVAKAQFDYLWRRYVIAGALIIGGLWFAYDGWVGWPKKNELYAQLQSELTTAQRMGESSKVKEIEDRLKNEGIEKHDDFAILLQKILACSLPPLGVAFLIWSLYLVRGAYRLSGTKLSIPGHPEIDIDDITKIDKQKWDRKGIAVLSYETGSGAKGDLTLNDMLYNRPATDEILTRIETRLLPATTTPPAATE